MKGLVNTSNQRKSKVALLHSNAMCFGSSWFCTDHMGWVLLSMTNSEEEHFQKPANPSTQTNKVMTIDEVLIEVH